MRNSNHRGHVHWLSITKIVFILNLWWFYFCKRGDCSECSLLTCIPNEDYTWNHPHPPRWQWHLLLSSALSYNGIILQAPCSHQHIFSVTKRGVFLVVISFLHANKASSESLFSVIVVFLFVWLCVCQERKEFPFLLLMPLSVERMGVRRSVYCRCQNCRCLKLLWGENWSQKNDIRGLQKSRRTQAATCLKGSLLLHRIEFLFVNYSSCSLWLCFLVSGCLHLASLCNWSLSGLSDMEVFAYS